MRHHLLHTAGIALLALAAPAFAQQDTPSLDTATPPPQAPPPTPEHAVAPPSSEPGTPLQSYRPTTPDKPLPQVIEEDKAAKAPAEAEQRQLLEQRYDMSDKPSGVMMSGNRKAVQQGVRVKTHGGATFDSLSRMSSDDIKTKNLFPYGFRPLPHVKHEVGGQVFPPEEIQKIQELEHRDLSRFDIDFDIPAHFRPEFPPPIFLQNRPDLGDVSKGQVVSFKNFFELFNGIMTPVQLEGMRLLLTPFPQEEFNMTDDRKVLEPSLGVACLDCHVNFHTNAAFHLNPDTRPQEFRHRLDSTSLRGLFNQQIHGSKRSLRSVEDFTEFEQRTAYFNGDHVSATKKGTFIPHRTEQVSMMAQAQNMIDFPPAPKLDEFGRLRKNAASKSELRGEQLFFGKPRCAECHPAPFYLDHQMHDLHLERFYNPEMINGQMNMQDGPIKAFTLRGIKDSPPYHHDGRLLTLDDTVEFFNLVLSLDLNQQEKEDLVAFMLCL